jgi:cytosine/adenosine deaminase-related metal-dependent hydrolase
MVGAHASFTLSDGTLAGCVEVARDAGTGVHIHVGEDQADQADSQARFGKRVVPRLVEAGALSDRSLAAHCVHLDADEVALLHDTGTVVAHNARSNMGNRVGRMASPVNGRATTLGTDGIGADMFAESRAAYWRGREDGWPADPAWALGMLQNGGVLLGRSFKGGFDMPGLHDWIGSINPGSLADVVVLDYQSPAPLRPGTFGGHWMFGLSSRHVRDVIVDGEIVVRDRRLTKADQDEIAAKASVEAARLWERMDAIPPHPFTPEGA